MTQVDGILIGAGGTVLVYFVVLGIRKTWAVATSMEEALRAVPPILAAIQNLVAAARDFQKELAFMRHIAMGGTPNSGVEDPENPPARQQSNAVNGAPEYPAPILSMYPQKPPDAPDAKPEDTEVFAQTEEEMAEEEKLQNLIDAGLAEREPIEPIAREVESQ